MRTSIALVGLMLGLSAVGCGASEPAGHGFVVRRAMVAGDLLYLGGSFREPANAAGNKLLGHEMLIVLDARDPTRPAFLTEHDLKATRAFSIFDGKLFAFQHGFDEDAPAGQTATAQNVRVKIYGLAGSARPALERTIEIPGTEGASVTTATAPNERTVLISIGVGTEGADNPLTWVLRLDAPAGSEVAGSANVACRAPSWHGAGVWCFNGLGRGTGFVLDLSLDAASGALAERARVAVGEFIVPVSAAATSGGGGPLIVADAMAGTFRMDSPAGIPSMAAATVDLPGSEAHAVEADTSGRVIVQTDRALNLIEPSTLGVAATLSVPGDPYQEYAGGSSVTWLRPAAASPPLEGLFAAALGDYGVVIVRVNGPTLEQVGGYYRHFGTDLLSENKLREGSY